MLDIEMENIIGDKSINKIVFNEKRLPIVFVRNIELNTEKEIATHFI